MKAEEMWERFMDHLKEVDPIGKPDPKKQGLETAETQGISRLCGGVQEDLFGSE